MNDAYDILEIPVDVKTHDFFMRCTRMLDLYATIKNGNYLVYYNNPIDIYKLGLNMATTTEQQLSNLTLKVNK